MKTRKKSKQATKPEEQEKLSEAELQQKILQEKQKRADMASQEVEAILTKYNCQLAARGIFEQEGYYLQPYIKAN